MPKNPYPVRTLYKNVQVFNVLDDGDTFSGADNSQILVYPEELSDGERIDLENGDLPNPKSMISIDMTRLLNEAMEARLECVKPLLELI